MNKFSIHRPDRESYLKHRRDVNRQILLPIVLVTLAGVVFAVLAGIGAAQNNANVGLWADISIIWLMIPIFFVALIILVITIAMVAGLQHLLKVSPYYTGQAQTYALWFSEQVKLWTDKLINPILVVNSWLGMFRKKED
jgi:hypothetical protein